MEFRLRLIKEHLKGVPVKAVARKWDISDSLLRKWIDHYGKLGDQGLLPQYGKHYSQDIKYKAVQAYQREGLSLRDCCLRYRIPSQATLLRWISQYEQLGMDGLIRKVRGRPRLMKKKPVLKETYGPLTRVEELEREILYLRAENDLLKKLEALTRQQQKAAQKRKH